MDTMTAFGTIQRRALVALLGTLMASTAFFSSAREGKAAPPTCDGLATLLLNSADITSATSAKQPAANGNAAYCLVNITVSHLAGPQNGYQPGQKQMINIGIGLPFSTADLGSGSVQGNWNGRIQNLGGGGYAGSVGPVTSATDAGYAGSSTDTGHPLSAGGTFALNPDGTLNWGLIKDFAINGIHEQTIWTKNLVQLYYGMGPKYTYWNGCSTGGRQGHEQAQMFPNDYDGILAGAPAFNWDRFIPAEQWGEIVMNQELNGTTIPSAQLDAVTAAAVNACQNKFNNTPDGIVQDPRACQYDAKAYICTAANTPANCLTPQQADSVNKIWNGPPGPLASLGPSAPLASQRLWFGLERGAPLELLDGATPFSISTQYLQYWVNQNPAFNWKTLTEQDFAFPFIESEIKFHGVIGTDNPDLTQFRNHGGKMIMYHGLADTLIFPRGSYNYYNRVEAAMGGLTEVRKFYRFFPYPGNGHCGPNAFPPSFGVPNPQPNAPWINSNDLFNALVNWVEKAQPPGDPSNTITAWNGPNDTGTYSRPICKYPDTLTYVSGPITSATSFTCTPQTTDPLMNAEQALPDIGPPGSAEH
jgi:Tannase and feruloyl esterase